MAVTVWLGCGSADFADPADDSGVAAGNAFEFPFAVYEIDAFAAGQKGRAVAHARVAVDLPDGSRRELETGQDGRVSIRVSSDAEWVTWTAAHGGLFPVTTFYRATLEEVRAQIAEDGEIYALMERLPPPMDPRVDVEVDCASRCCVSFNMGGCQMGATGQTNSIRQSSQPYPLVAISTDEAGRPLALTETTLPDTLTDQSTEIDFAEASGTEPVFVHLTLLLPTDPTSPIVRDGVYDGAGHPARAEDHTVNRFRGYSFDKHTDLEHGTYELTLGYFPKEGAELDLEVRVFALPDQTHAFRWSAPLAGLSMPEIPPDGTYRLLDFPRLTSPTAIASRASRFSWQPIEGAKMYELHAQTAVATDYYERIDRTLWIALSWSHQDIVLPEPPSGYDLEEQWGEPAVGEYRVIACDRWLPWSHRRLWWEPRAAAATACGYGQAMAGPLY